MDVIDQLERLGARIRLGDLGEEQRGLLYEVLQELEQDQELGDNRSLSFLAPLYAQAVLEQKGGAIERLEVLAMDLGPGIQKKDVETTTVVKADTGKTRPMFANQSLQDRLVDDSVQKKLVKQVLKKSLRRQRWIPVFMSSTLYRVNLLSMGRRE